MIKLNYPKFWQTYSLLSWLLLPLSAIYFLLGKLRYLIVTPRRFPAKVICIGNATVGGTGKTQVAIWLAKKLQAKGMKPLILCKGYGGSFQSPMIVEIGTSAEIVGDEALELCEYATTIVSSKPHEAMTLLQGLSPDVIIVDDGMQNPSFIKDFIIMVVDGARGFGNQMLFPAGPMRQSVESSLKMADAVIVTGLAQSAQSESDVIKELMRLDKAYKATILPQSPLDSKYKYYAFTGIGNPERFFALCQSLGEVVATKAFPDHHKYSEDDVTALLKEATKLNAKLVTTRKDSVKLRSFKDIISLNVTLGIEGGDSLIDQFLDMHFSNMHYPRA